MRLVVTTRLNTPVIPRSHETSVMTVTGPVTWNGAEIAGSIIFMRTAEVGRGVAGAGLGVAGAGLGVGVAATGGGVT